MTGEIPDLSGYSISALLEMGVDERTFCPWFKFSALTQLLTLRVVGLVHMSCSRAWEDRFAGDSNVLEISNERRKLTFGDLSGYPWNEPTLVSIPELTVIKIEGGLNITVICDSFEMALEPLSLQYPHMV
jgi:hypothetical protein